jgi:hypothetical protein
MQGQHELLIRGQLACERRHAAEILAQEHKRLESRAHVDLPGLHAVERHRCLERRLHRAAARERATSILDPREKSLLKRVGDVQSTVKASTATGFREQLERRLGDVQAFDQLPAAANPTPLRVRSTPLVDRPQLFRPMPA